MIVDVPKEIEEGKRQYIYKRGLMFLGIDIFANIRTGNKSPVRTPFHCAARPYFQPLSTSPSSFGFLAS